MKKILILGVFLFAIVGSIVTWIVMKKPSVPESSQDNINISSDFTGTW